MSYLSNTAAEVRKKGYEKAAEMGERFGNNWIMNEFVPEVLRKYGEDKKGYNYRMCCIHSLAAVMPFMTKEQITQHVVPTLVTACKDAIPNVKFCAARVINEKRQTIDPHVFSN